MRDKTSDQLGRKEKHFHNQEVSAGTWALNWKRFKRRSGITT